MREGCGIFDTVVVDDDDFVIVVVIVVDIEAAGVECYRVAEEEVFCGLCGSG